MGGAIPLLSLYTIMAWPDKMLPILSLYITYLLQYRSWQQEMHVLAYHEVIMTSWTLQNVTQCEISWTATNFLNHCNS
jgi:hypothetical protein